MIVVGGVLLALVGAVTWFMLRKPTETTHVEAKPHQHQQAVVTTPPPPACNRGALERAAVESESRKMAALPELFGKDRATPGPMFDALVLGATVDKAISDRIAPLLREDGMELMVNPQYLSTGSATDPDTVRSIFIRVGHFDATYPGTCDPANECDCIGPGDERRVCSALAHALVNTWGRPDRGKPDRIFTLGGYGDELRWTHHGRIARLTVNGDLAFERR